MVSCMFYMIKVIMWYQRRHWNQQNTGWLPQHAQTSDFALFEQRKERRGLGVPRLPGPNANKLMDHWRVDQIGLENIIRWHKRVGYLILVSWSCRLHIAHVLQ